LEGHLKSLTVLHVDTERGWRGGERQALWLARELGRRGHRSLIAARADQPLAARASEAGLPVIPCGPAFEGDPRAAFALRRAIRRHHVNIVHAHTAHGAALGALATLGSGIPLVVARRVDFPLRGNLGTRLKYGRAAAVIAVSNAVARVLAKADIVAGKIVVVPDATDVHRTIEPASTATLRAAGVRDPEHAPLVVQVAQLVGHKDPLNFVRAVAAARGQVPNVQALLAGDGPLRGDVERLRDELGLGGTLHVLGFRTDADALLAAAHVVTLSSREEGMGSVLLDALMLGKPIAATDAGGIPEVVEHDVSGLVTPHSDGHALGNAIARIIMDPSLAERFSTAARARALEFSVERMTERTLDVYDRVLPTS
jgi:glycosyltransferase involved in cell wall biosynthesis